MHFMVVWTFEPHASQATIDRFKETGGTPPDGVAMLSRWHDVSGRRGFALAEADDIVPVGKWCRRWNDLLTFKVIPVVDDEQLVEILTEGS